MINFMTSCFDLSHPARGAWIEMFCFWFCLVSYARRTPQGVRGLKFEHVASIDGKMGRTPQGVRGLKCLVRGKYY